ncbi:MAG: NAD(P)H-hydrate epimerase [Candidatus Omnitrophota bacterium]|jgi:NAD(P)H-hydrate epimerase
MPRNKSESLLTAAQAKALDKKAQEEFGISTLVLMENAGRAIMEEALKTPKSSRGNIAVFCGTGNNGGDGFCAVRHLLTQGIKPDLYLAGRIKGLKNEARTNLNILLKLKYRIVEINLKNLGPIKNRINKYSLIVDALLGVGISGEIRPLYQRVIDIINSSDVYVLSVDIPSGLDATTGKALGRCVKADKTVTFVCRKRGMVYGDGAKYCGKILVKAIGVPYL